MTSIDLFKKEEKFIAFEASQVIFGAGQLGDCMYAIIDGLVEIIANDHTIDVAGPRSASARAQTPCKLVAVDQKRFTFWVQQTPYFAI